MTSSTVNESSPRSSAAIVTGACKAAVTSRKRKSSLLLLDEEQLKLVPTVVVGPFFSNNNSNSNESPKKQRPFIERVEALKFSSSHYSHRLLRSGDDEEEIDCIRIGPNYQVDCLPTLGDVYAATENVHVSCLWDPQRAEEAKVAGQDIDAYLNRSSEFSVRVLLMEALHRVNYQTAPALQLFYRLHADRPHTSVKWSSQKQKRTRFPHLLQAKDFSQASKKLGCRPERIMVQYYRWKGSHPGPYREFKRARSELQKNDVCSVCQKGGSLIVCETCQSAVHCHCVDLQRIPDGAWFCDKCCQPTPRKMHRSPATTPKGLTLTKVSFPQQRQNQAASPRQRAALRAIHKEWTITPSPHDGINNKDTPGTQSSHSVASQLNNGTLSASPSVGLASPEKVIPVGMRWSAGKHQWEPVVANASPQSAGAPEDDAANDDEHFFEDAAEASGVASEDDSESDASSTLLLSQDRKKHAKDDSTIGVKSPSSVDSPEYNCDLSYHEESGAEEEDDDLQDDCKPANPIRQNQQNPAPKPPAEPSLQDSSLAEFSIPMSPEGFLLNIGRILIGDKKQQMASFCSYRRGGNGQKGYAEQHNLFRAGDILMSIDGVTCEKETFDEVLELLRKPTFHKRIGILRCHTKLARKLLDRVNLERAAKIFQSRAAARAPTVEARLPTAPSRSVVNGGNSALQGPSQSSINSIKKNAGPVGLPRASTEVNNSNSSCHNSADKDAVAGEQDKRLLPHQPIAAPNEPTQETSKDFSLVQFNLPIGREGLLARFGDFSADKKRPVVGFLGYRRGGNGQKEYAEQHNLFRPGDILMTVNLVACEKKTVDEVMQMLKKPAETVDIVVLRCQKKISWETLEKYVNVLGDYFQRRASAGAQPAPKASLNAYAAQGGSVVERGNSTLPVPSRPLVDSVFKNGVSANPLCAPTEAAPVPLGLKGQMPLKKGRTIQQGGDESDGVLPPHETQAPCDNQRLRTRTNTEAPQVVQFHLPVQPGGFGISIGASRRPPHKDVVVFAEYRRGLNGEKGYAEQNNLFREGDVFLAIDGVNCSTKSMDQVSQLLRAPTGQKSVVVLRSQATVSWRLIQDYSLKYQQQQQRTQLLARTSLGLATANNDGSLSVANGAMHDPKQPALGKSVIQGANKPRCDDQDKSDSQVQLVPVNLPIQPGGFFINLSVSLRTAQNFVVVFRGYRRAPNNEMGFAERNNLFREGDVILMVDACDCTTKSLEEVMDLLRAPMPSGQKYLILLRSREEAPWATIQLYAQVLRDHSPREILRQSATNTTNTLARSGKAPYGGARQVASGENTIQLSQQPADNATQQQRNLPLASSASRPLQGTFNLSRPSTSVGIPPAGQLAARGSHGGNGSDRNKNLVMNHNAKNGLMNRPVIVSQLAGLFAPFGDSNLSTK